jgi:hypothetical protein
MNMVQKPTYNVLFLITNMITGFKLFAAASMKKKKKGFIRLTPGLNVIKLFYVLDL